MKIIAGVIHPPNQQKETESTFLILTLQTQYTKTGLLLTNQSILWHSLTGSTSLVIIQFHNYDNHSQI